MADLVLLCGLLTVISLSVSVICIDEAGTTGQPETHNIIWSANVSTMYPASSPLDVKLGDQLNITCPPNGASNVWIQTDLRQYEMCNCTADGLRNPDCNVSITTRQVCQDEVLIAITSDSNDLKSALSFESGTTYYLISYSPGNKPWAGYSEANAGGECLNGYKMAMKVQPLAVPTTTATTMATTTTDDKDNLFTKATTAKDITTLEPKDKELSKAGGLNGTATELASGVVTWVSAVVISLSFVYS